MKRVRLVTTTPCPHRVEFDGMAASPEGFEQVSTLPLMPVFRRQIDDSLACLGVKGIHKLDRSCLGITWPRQRA